MKPQAPVPSILLADDDKLSRERLTSFFSGAGWFCDLAEDVPGLLLAAQVRDYDVIITDFCMQREPGAELLRKLHEQKPGQAIIVVTSPGNVGDAISSLRHGAVDIISRPIDTKALRESVLRVVSSLRQREVENQLYRFVKAETISLKFESRDLGKLKFPLPIVEKLQRSGRIDRGTRLKLELAFQEALTNSLEHGNLELESKWKDEVSENGKDTYTVLREQRLREDKFGRRQLGIEVALVGNRLSIAISDQGRGFSRDTPKKIEETGPNNPRCYGRGISIIGGVMDEFSYSKNGTELTMVKYLNETDEKLVGDKIN